MEILVLVFLLVSTLSTAAPLAQEDTFVGVNIGTKVSTMPQPAEVASLLKSQKIEHVRLYDADPNMLVALANTSIKVAVSVPNDQILGISQSNSTAAKWVSQNVLTHYPSTNITTICVGTDVLTSMPNATTLLPNALKHIHLALVAANLDKQIQISTPLSSTIIFKSFPSPPSQAHFNTSLINPLLLPLLKFLQSTNSPFMINMYPYLEHVQSNDVVSLDYALFKPLPVSKQPVDTNTSLRYSNAFDAMVDAAYSAMASLNITDVRVVVAETGWPSEGAEDEGDATSDNARVYNTNLIKHVMNRTGTPRHPGIAVSTYIYELYNEDVKISPLSERNWGLFEANGESVYAIKFSGSDLAAGNESTSRTYCTAKAGADEKMVQAALDWACGAGKVDCSAMMAGQPCFEPDTLAAHATYAFDSYYQQMGRAAGSCDFDGVAAITSTAPSGGMCAINSGNGSDKNGSSLNSTAPPAMDSDDSYASSASGGYGDAFEASKFVIGLIGCVVAALLI